MNNKKYLYFFCETKNEEIKIILFYLTIIKLKPNRFNFCQRVLVKKKNNYNFLLNFKLFKQVILHLM